MKILLTHEFIRGTTAPNQQSPSTHDFNRGRFQSWE